MYGIECSTEMMGQIMDLGMTVMTSGDAVVGPGGNDLVILELAIGPARFRMSRLQETAPAATAVVIGFIRGHFDEIFFTDDRFDNKPQIVRNLIAKTLTNDLTGVLNGELDTTIFIPVGIYF